MSSTETRPPLLPFRRVPGGAVFDTGTDRSMTREEYKRAHLACRLQLYGELVQRNRSAHNHDRCVCCHRRAPLIDSECPDCRH